MMWAYVAMTALSAYSSMKSANDQAESLQEEGEIQTKNKAKEVMAKADAQRVSFLSAGLDLEGTPQAVMQSTYQSGIQDIQQIRSNYNSQIKNSISEGRSSVLKSLAQAFGSASFAGGSAASSASSSSLAASPASSSYYPVSGTTVNWNSSYYPKSGTTINWNP